MGLGLASFVMNITESLINIAFNASLSKYGGDVAVGAMTILASIMQLQFMPLQSLHTRNGWKAWQASSRGSGSYLQNQRKRRM